MIGDEGRVDGGLLSGDEAADDVAQGGSIADSGIVTGY